MILLLKGQIHSDGTLDDTPPIARVAISGEIGGDAAVTGAVANGTGCNGHSAPSLSELLQSVT